MVPFEFQALSVIIWTCIAAFIIAPTMVWRKILKHRADPQSIKDDVVEHVDSKIDALDAKFETEIQGVSSHFDDSIGGIEQNLENRIDEIRPQDLEDFDPKKLYEDIKKLMAEDINQLQENLPTIIINCLNTEEGQHVLAEAAIASGKAVSGAIYREMGIDKEKAEEGIRRTREWYVNNIQNAKPGANKMVDTLKWCLRNIFPDEDNEEWIDEKIAAIRELQNLWNDNGQNQTGSHTSLPAVQPPRGRQVIPIGGMQG